KLCPFAQFLYIAKGLLLNRGQAACNVALRWLRLGEVILFLVEDQLRIVLEGRKKLLADLLTCRFRGNNVFRARQFARLAKRRSAAVRAVLVDYVANG